MSRKRLSNTDLKDPEAIATQLAQGTWFKQIEPSFQKGLLARGKVRRLAAREPLFFRDDPSDGLYAVLEGSIEIGSVDASGQLAVLTVVEPAMWFGEVAVLDGLLRTHDARAMRPAKLFHVPERELSVLTAERPERWRELAWLTTGKLRLTFKVTEDAALLDASQRLASRLLLISDGYDGAGATQTQLSLSQGQLAAMLSMSRQTVNRVLRRFESKGMLKLSQGRVDLLDRDGLKSVVDCKRHHG